MYDANVARLSFDELMQNLKVSMGKFQEDIDSDNYVDEEKLHEGMDNMLQDILQLWSNEDTKLCNVHELRVLTQEALVMYKKRHKLFWYS